MWHHGEAVPDNMSLWDLTSLGGCVEVEGEDVRVEMCKGYMRVIVRDASV